MPMAREFDFPVEAAGEPTAPLLWVSYQGFRRATGEELRSPLPAEREERLRHGLATLDNDFPEWLEDVETETEDGLMLRFRDVEAVRNVASTLRNRGLNDR
ncbi:MAG TPA: hypothetical protein VFU47_01635 [Armatimonadota bacterium]|nr:hypothetical protein [Armatimonadota bacterium]